MKLNLKNNQLILLLSIIDVAIQILYAIKRAHYFYINIYIIYSLIVISELCFVLSLFYLTAIVKYLNERTFILKSFYWFISMSIFLFITGTTLFNFLNNQFFDTFINALTVISTIYLIVILFFIRDPFFSGSFRIYAYAAILVTFFDFFIPLATPLISNPDFYFKAIKYVGFLHVIPLIAIAYIVYKSKALITQTKPLLS
ncbi:hypothetical protein HDF18_00705 [Mucilaginibacter sp. X5P1]|uniref:hypothetical protein n=1 Tax=Mucilaginibacter sp. X5P1 TaxID=2723088 RepID=UPI00160C1190|nr:hypothetical protein [Mucilaginibacter sp. X5P1]MBB6138383.1 hypothetical protein [Mucilaginibacter sp. X5P1]